MSKGVAIRYGDITVGARENFAPSVKNDDKTPFSDLEKFKADRAKFPNYSNPCDYYSTLLDGNAIGIPEENVAISLWSESISNSNGVFDPDNPIELTFTSENYYSSSGLTLVFDTANDVYCNHLKIEWFNENENSSFEQEFNPNNAMFYCEKEEAHKEKKYNKFVITFYSINMPYNRLKLNEIEYGTGINLTGAELRNVNLIQEIDPISTQISINTCDFVLDSKSDYNFEFQVRQPLEISFNGELKATAFVKNSKRIAKNMWRVESEDYIGLLDTVPFSGGLYNGVNGKDVIKEIFKVAQIPYDDNEIRDNINLVGYIPYTTCREALMQVCFAMGVVADTTNAGVVKLYSLNETLTQTIPKERIMQGQNFEKATRVTAVEVVSHAYVEANTTITAYDATKSGVGDNILVVFSEPLHDLSITNGNFAVDENENELKHTNYAIINAKENCVLTGSQYNHTTVTKSMKNTDAKETDIQNIVSVQNATLVSASNIDKVLSMCYNHIIRDTTVNMKIIEGKHETAGGVYYGRGIYGEAKYSTMISQGVTTDDPVNVGDTITVETEYLGDITGVVTKQSFNLNGGIIVKDTTMVVK